MIKIEFAPGALRQMENLVRQARGFERQMGDRNEPLKKIKRRQIKRWAQNFASEGGIYGAWPALSESWTVPDREAQGYGGTGPMLVRTGSVMSWFQASNEQTRDTNQAIQWNFQWGGGKDGSLAVLHSEGYYNTLAGRSVAPRKLWDLDAEDRKAAEEIVEAWVGKIIERYFGAM